jgi:Leucine-rich repeat (LRR) protein
MSEEHEFVCYITEDLIKKVAKSDNLRDITSLDLHFRKETNQRIKVHIEFVILKLNYLKYIEKFDSLINLTYLNLSNNYITKIDNLNKLIQLKELNLSNNRIEKISNLDGLKNLEILNLSGNIIKRIPSKSQGNASNQQALIQPINRNNYKSSFITHVASIPTQKLRSLDLANNQLSVVSNRI